LTLFDRKRIANSLQVRNIQLETSPSNQHGYNGLEREGLAESSLNAVNARKAAVIILYVWVRPLQHIMQRHRNDCVIATAAIVANVSYETAAAHSPVEPGKRGLHTREVVRVLKRVTGISWRSPEFGWFRPTSRFVAQPSPLVLGLRQPWNWRREWHCIV